MYLFHHKNLPPYGNLVEKKNKVDERRGWEWLKALFHASGSMVFYDIIFLIKNMVSIWASLCSFNMRIQGGGERGSTPTHRLRKNVFF